MCHGGNLPPNQEPLQLQVAGRAEMGGVIIGEGREGDGKGAGERN